MNPLMDKNVPCLCLLLLKANRRAGRRVEAGNLGSRMQRGLWQQPDRISTGEEALGEK